MVKYNRSISMQFGGKRHCRRCCRLMSKWMLYRTQHTTRITNFLWENFNGGKKNQQNRSEAKWRELHENDKRIIKSKGCCSIKHLKLTTAFNFEQISLLFLVSKYCASTLIVLLTIFMDDMYFFSQSLSTSSSFASSCSFLQTCIYL